MSLPPFLIPIGAGLLAQAMKPILNREWRQDQATRQDVRPRYGGMPSAHTAFAVSLAVTTSFVDGVWSAAFAVAVGLLILILDDALRLRVFLGRFGAAIGRVASLLPESERRTLPRIEQTIGHTVPEVLAGALVGLVVTLGVFLIDRGA